ncbi:DNA polymerase I [Porphyromonas loveana]|uniref:DNA polymerase I n=1 Tax=Porphyromonas loveana TaxID=1884669 RepID=UPI0035A0BA24
MLPSQAERLFLLDAYALIFRAYYAFIRAPRLDSSGRDTGAVFGFALTLLDILEKESPHYLAVVFDPPGGSFRHREYPEYKAQREETPEAIRLAVPLIKELLAAFRVPVVEVPDFEADDAIGTLARQAAAEGLEVRMVTPDKDFGQLVTDTIRIYRPKTSGGGYETWGPEEVTAKFGLSRPEQMIDYLALVGDASDNIPGCKGIGAKTAEKLLADYDSIDGIYANVDAFKGALARKIAEGEEQTRFSRYLATIRTDAPVAFDRDTFRRVAPDMEAVRACFGALEFRSLLRRVEAPAPDVPAGDLFADEAATDASSVADLFADGAASATAGLRSLAEVPHDYIILENDSEIADCVRTLSAVPRFAFDTETDSKDALVAQLVAVTFAAESGRAYFISMPEDADVVRRRLDLLRPLWDNAAIGKVGQNIKYDLQVLARYGVEVRGTLFDTMIAHYLLFPDLRHGMDEMAESLLSYRTIRYDELMPDKERSIRDVPLQQLADYAMEDADITWQLYERLSPLLDEAGMTDLFCRIEMPLVPVLASMERAGVMLDVDVLNRTASGLNEEMQRIEEEIYRHAGHPFNINSPSQVGAVLFDELAVADKPKKTKSGTYSTNEEILTKLRDRHPVVPLILDYRGLKKLLSTYVDTLPRMRYPDGKLHTSFNQTVATTGRLSSSNPNLQNIPIRTEIGRGLRAAFVPDDEDCIFLSADYSQIELRLMAHLSGDASLIEAFLHGEDIHRATAARIYDLPPAEVTDDMRRRAKTANFGIIYGISAFGLSERLGITRTEAKALIEGYFASYPQVKEYMDRSIAEAGKLGYVTTICGRKRFLRDIHSANSVVRGYAERNAINAPIQGSAADLIKLAMIRIRDEFDARRLQARMILQVHDELNFNVPVAELDEVREIVREGMEGVMPELRVPLIADIGVGANWLEAH